MRRDPRVSVTVMDGAGLVPAADAFGRVDEIRDDPEFEDIDRLSLRYTRRHVQQPAAREDQRADRAGALVRLGGLEPLAVSGAGAAPAGTILRDGNAAPRPHSHGRVRDRTDGARDSRRRRADGRAAVGDAHGGPADARSHVRAAPRAPSFLARIRRGEIGGVVLYSDNYGAGRADVARRSSCSARRRRAAAAAADRDRPGGRHRPAAARTADGRAAAR